MGHFNGVLGMTGQQEMAVINVKYDKTDPLVDSPHPNSLNYFFYGDIYVGSYGLVTTVVGLYDQEIVKNL